MSRRPSGVQRQVLMGQRTLLTEVCTNFVQTEEIGILSIYGACGGNKLGIYSAAGCKALSSLELTQLQ
jgi:hypothetical protein